MPRGPNDKKFEADIPQTMWDEFEAWAKDRTDLSNRQILRALFRVFLAAPEGIKLLALYGRGDQLARATEMREDFLAAEILDDALADEARLLEGKGAPDVAHKGSGKKRRRKTG